MASCFAEIIAKEPVLLCPIELEDRLDEVPQTTVKPGYWFEVSGEPRRWGRFDCFPTPSGDTVGLVAGSYRLRDEEGDLLQEAEEAPVLVGR